ncbi:tandem-95 repeat protein [Rubripirellula obstinata]|uniref:tandem-95 repeat protein n=1 Tax=Rubripirellula obstinata TaxID=406547 RepID=UPI001EE419AA|nr:tandem-95 repeat protein [Rubripirellula obstinata]
MDEDETFGGTLTNAPSGPTDIPISTFATDVDDMLTPGSLSFTGVTVEGVAQADLATAGITYNDTTGAFAFDGGAAVYQSLNAGEEIPVVVTFEATDGDLTDTGSVTFTVRGVNDPPQVTSVDPAVDTEGDTGTPDVVTIDLFDELVTASDIDDADTPSLDGSSIAVAAATGSATANTSLISVNSGTGEISYDRAAFDFLDAGESAIYEVSFDIVSGTDTVPQTVTLTINGTNDGPVANVIAAGTFPTVDEDETFGGTLTNAPSGPTDIPISTFATDVDDMLTPGSLSFTGVTVEGVAQADLATAGITYNDTTGAFAFDGGAAVYQSLNAGEEIPVVVTFEATDGDLTDTGSVTFTVRGVNDPPQVTSVDPAVDTEGDTGTPDVVTIDLFDELVTASDIDDADTPSLDGSSIAVAAATGSATANTSLISVNSGTGEISYDRAAFDFLDAGESAIYEVSFDVVSGTDTVSQSVTLTINGTNDGPVVDTIAQTNLDEQTDTDDITADIDVTFTDVDLTDVGHTASITGVTTVGTTTGLDLDATALTGLISVGTVTKASGTDNGDVTLTFTAGSTAFDYLADGEVLTLTYTVEIDDEEGLGNSTGTQTFVVEITGTNDAPVVDTIAQTNLNEQTDTDDITADIDVTFTDVDLTDVGHTASITGVTTGGTTTGLDLDATALTGLISVGTVTKASGTDNGEVTLTFTAGSTAFDYLAEGEVLTLTYTVEIDDEEGLGNSTGTQTFVVEITGTNDDPSVTVVDVDGAVTETADQADDATVLSDVGSVVFTDVDLTDRPTASEATSSVSAIQQGGGTLVLTGTQRDTIENAFSIAEDSGNTNNGTVTWDYSITEGELDFLRAGDVVTAVFAITVTDDDNSTASQDVTIIVTGTNDSPDTVADTYLTAAGSPLSVVQASGLLANDSDVDGPQSALSVTQVTGNSSTASVGDPLFLQKGTVVVQVDGSFTFNPNPGAVGLETFQYAVRDFEGATSTETVTIAILSGNNSPIAIGDFANTVGMLPVDVQVLTNDFDLDGDNLTITHINGMEIGSTGGPAVGDNVDIGIGDVTIKNTDDSGSGAFTFTPIAGFSGLAAFSYRVTDGNGGIAAAQVLINVAAPANQAPLAVDDAFTIGEDPTSPLSGNVLSDNTVAPDPMAQDSDPDGDPLVVSLVSTTANGDLTLNSDGSFNYQPDADFNGTDQFIYLIQDGNGGVDTATVTINISAVDDAADINGVDLGSIDEDSSITFSDADLLAGSSDVDSVLTVDSVALATGMGTLTDNMDSTYTFAPDADWNGEVEFTVTILGTDVTSSLTVTPVNDAPVAVDGTASTDEDVAITAGDLTADVTDVDSTGLTYVTLTQPTDGTLVLNGNGSFSYTPDANFFGSDSFTYRVLDGSGGSDEATVNITVTSDNDLPTADDQSVSVDENTPVAIVLTGSDVETDPLTIFAVVDQPTSGTLSGTAPNLTYTPNANFFGSDSFTFTVEDADGGVSSTATVSISVGSVNSTPVVDNLITAADATEGTAYSLPVPTNTFSDVEDATLTLSASGLPSWLSFDGSEFSGTPLNGDDGTTTITVTATDSEGASVDTTFDLTVLAVNDAPVAVNDSATTAEDTPVTIDVSANDTDVDDASLTVSLETGDTAPAGGSVAVVGNSVVYTPTADFFGSDTFTYTVTDAGGETGTATVNVTVTPVNDAPTVDAVVALADSDEDVVVTINAVDLLAGALDDDGDTLSVANLTASSGAIVDNNDGTFEFTPAADDDTDVTFNYDVTDGIDTVMQSATLDLLPVNDDPVVLDQIFSVDENSLLGVDVDNILGGNQVLFSDVEGDMFDFALSGTGASDFAINMLTGAITVANSSNFEMTPTYDLTVTVTDNNDSTSSTSATVTINVNDINETPVATDDSVNGVNTAMQIFDVLANDVDPDGDILAVSIDGTTLSVGSTVTLPSVGTLTYIGNGTMSFQAFAGYQGNSTFDYTISDPDGLTDVGTVTLAIIDGSTAGAVAVDDNFMVAEDGVLSVPAATGVLSNETNTAGLGLTASLESFPSNGTVSMLSTGSFVYTPIANFVGQDSFTYRLTDSMGNQSVGTVTVDVTSANDAPVITVPTIQPLAEDAAAGDFVAQILANDGDDGSQPLTYDLSGPDAAAFEISSTGEITVSSSADLNFELQDTYVFDVVVSDGSPALTSTAQVTVNLADVAEPGPRVTQVYVNSTAWADNFADVLDNEDPLDNTNLGYPVPMNGDQLLTLPWINLNEIVFFFDTDVSQSITVDDFRLEAIAGVRADELPGTIPGILAVIPDGDAVRIRLNSALDASQVTITAFAAGITDVEGNQLDGDYSTSPTTDSDSGNGTAGGDFVFQLNVLPGDVNQDNFVNLLDTGAIQPQGAVFFGQTGYDILRDVNGGLNENSVDEGRVSDREGSRLF